MIFARPFRTEDIKAIDVIHKNQSDFGVPSLNNIIVNSTVEKNGRVIGYGVIKLFAEAYMILDPKEDKKSKANAFKELLLTGITTAKDSGLEELFLISNNEEFSKILCKKYTFKRVPGELLMLELNLEEKSDGQ